MKLTEEKLESLITMLNEIICDEFSITREQRENMVRTVATPGALSERYRLNTTTKIADKQAKEEKKHANLILYFHVLEKRGCKRSSTYYIPLSMIFRMKVSTTTFCGYQSDWDEPPML